MDPARRKVQDGAVQLANSNNQRLVGLMNWIIYFSVPKHVKQRNDLAFGASNCDYDRSGLSRDSYDPKLMRCEQLASPGLNVRNFEPVGSLKTDESRIW